MPSFSSKRYIVIDENDKQSFYLLEQAHGPYWLTTTHLSREMIPQFHIYNSASANAPILIVLSVSTQELSYFHQFLVAQNISTYTVMSA